MKKWIAFPYALRSNSLYTCWRRNGCVQTEAQINHIIIADCDPATRKALTLLLQRKLGTHLILEADSAEALIRSPADTSLDLLLLDWKLYGSPAAKTCRRLQRADPELKIVLLSINVEDPAAAKEAGAAFIHKGASPDELVTTLTPLLRKENESA